LLVLLFMPVHHECRLTDGRRVGDDAWAVPQTCFAAYILPLELPISRITYLTRFVRWTYYRLQRAVPPTAQHKQRSRHGAAMYFPRSRRCAAHYGVCRFNATSCACDTSRSWRSAVLSTLATCFYIFRLACDLTPNRMFFAHSDRSRIFAVVLLRRIAVPSVYLVHVCAVYPSVRFLLCLFLAAGAMP